MATLISLLLTCGKFWRTKSCHKSATTRRGLPQVSNYRNLARRTFMSSEDEGAKTKALRRESYFFLASAPVSLVDSAAMKASWGTSTRPTIFMRFLPSFCFSSSLRFRVMSPP